MKIHHELRRLSAPTRQLLGATAFLAIALACQPPARGASLADQAHSLRSVPADAAFYAVTLRLREQLDIFLGSKAYEKLMQVPVVQLAKMQVSFQWQQSQEPVVAKVRAYLQSPEGGEALALLKDMWSVEVFCYGGKEMTETLELILEIQAISRHAQIEALASGQPPEEAANRVKDALAKHGEKLVVPDLVFGFRVEDRDRATRHLDVVRDALVNWLNEVRPELSPHVAREQIAGHEFVTLRLNGSLLPWDEFRAESSEVDEETFNKWKDLFSRKTLAFAVGVVDGFVVASVGDSTEHLEHYGKGPLLADVPDFGRLNQHAAERIVSISFASAEIADIANSPRRNIENMADLAEVGLQALKLDADRRDAILANVRGLTEDLLHYVPQPGAIAAVAFLTARGTEGFQYRTGSMPSYVSTQPLTIVDHWGGEPFLAVASRTKQTLEEYDRTVSWLKRVALDVEQIAKEKTPPENWADFERLRPKIMDLLARCNRANREHLFPAFDDGQLALVLDAHAKSDRWIGQMPTSEKPLPMLEFAVVGSVSDAKHLRAGVSEYFHVIQDTISLLHAENVEQVPDVHLPAPEERKEAGKSLYVYPCPAEWGVDPQVSLTAGLTDSTWAVTLFPSSTIRLLDTTPLSIDTSLDVRRPAAMITYVELPQLLNVVRPWVDYGFALSMQKSGEPEGDAAEKSAAMMPAGFILPQVHQILDVLAAVRSFTSVTYHDEDAWVTHSELHVVDLE